MTTVGEAIYFAVDSGGYPDIGLGRQRWKHSYRAKTRSLGWKAPWVRPQAVAFASDRTGRPFKARRDLRIEAGPAS